MPQHFSRATIVTGMPLCSKIAVRSSPMLRLVAIAVTGGEQHHFAGCRRPASPRASVPAARVTLAIRLAVIFGHRRLADAHRASCRAACAERRVLFTALTICATTGMPAMLADRIGRTQNLVAQLTSPFSNLNAFARSIRCGKSMFHGCGGTYGHLVM